MASCFEVSTKVCVCIFVLKALWATMGVLLCAGLEVAFMSCWCSCLDDIPLLTDNMYVSSFPEKEKCSHINYNGKYTNQIMATSNITLTSFCNLK